MKLLLVEDNPELVKSIGSYLVHENNICEMAFTIEEAREKLALFSYDCLILDIMLPDGNGINLLKFIKKEEIEICVIIISAKNSLDFKVTGFDEGADDYITKPFPLPELYSRIKAVTRRNNKSRNYIEFNDIVVDLLSMETKINELPIILTRKETNLLIYFLNNQNRILSRQAIASHLWGDYTDNLDNFDFVYQHIKNLRKKITDAGGEDCISTIYGLGYKMST
ncbi:response regulator transcription factor [Flavobacterium plurextorum]|uniref:DNA-binding response regulator n=1 Tax=Flavobacterium plurextorum TaxID=1114867 RepID=A0ABX4CS68_9FLAO|nr:MULTISPECIES: response regulator transcription factor [Flavobacterium]OXB04181.1 DNA-binding response regulator [Flavobacterium plurextorum]PIF60422.1 DNA-binding response OmpR family regulator [Flavobacterium sp. 2]UUW10800.1 response regulator transcription factor [Flavobacterium plurextorum]